MPCRTSSRPDALRGVLTADAAIWECLCSSNDDEASDARDEFDEFAPQFACALEASCRGKWRRDRLFELAARAEPYSLGMCCDFRAASASTHGPRPGVGHREPL